MIAFVITYFTTRFITTKASKSFKGKTLEHYEIGFWYFKFHFNTSIFLTHERIYTVESKFATIKCKFVVIKQVKSIAYRQLYSIIVERSSSCFNFRLIISVKNFNFSL